MSGLNKVAEENPPSLGLVPLYPFPILPPAQNAIAGQSNPLPVATYGVPFLPPIYQHFYGSNSADNQTKNLAAEVLNEVVAEEILDVLEKLFSTGGDFLDEAVKKDIKRKEVTENRLSKLVAKNCLEEVIGEECKEIVDDVIDDMIERHFSDITTRILAEEIFRELEKELLVEHADNVLDMCACGESCIHIVRDVVHEELHGIVEEVLRHYGAQVAFAQYRQIAKFAADYTLDDMCGQLLLPSSDSQPEVLTSVLDHVMADILLRKCLEINECSKMEKCVPLQWYRKKVVRNVAMEMTLDELCRTVDEMLS